MIYILLLIYTHVVAALIGSVIHNLDPGPLWQVVFVILFWHALPIVGLIVEVLRMGRRLCDEYKYRKLLRKNESSK